MPDDRPPRPSGTDAGWGFAILAAVIMVILVHRHGPQRGSETQKYSSTRNNAPVSVAPIPKTHATASRMPSRANTPT